MDSFLRLYTIYRSISNWKIIVRIYSEAALFFRVLMWLAKLAFIIFAGMAIFAPSWHPFSVVILVPAIIWAWSFSKARAEVFSDFYRLYPDRIKYFGKDYQYIRYLIFRERLELDSFTGNVMDALAFLDDHLDTESHSSATSHPFISVTLGTLLAIVGGVSGSWSANYAVIAILTLILILYFSYIILGFTRTPQSDLKEFKRFLLWARNETARV